MTTLVPPTINHLQSFFKEFGEELDNCNPAAFDLLQSVLNKEEYKLFDDFVYYYADELEACNPDAFAKLLEIIEILGIEY